MVTDRNGRSHARAGSSGGGRFEAAAHSSADVSLDAATSAQTPIPPLRFEEIEWRTEIPEYISNAEHRRQTGTYEAAIPARISDLQAELSSAQYADLEEATSMLRLFDAYTASVLGSKSPTLGPMSSILLRTESASSSQIENLTTSAQQLALAELGESDKVNALTVVGNVRSMESALKLSSNIDQGAILGMHRELLSRQFGMEDFAGTYRDEQVWIGGDSAGPIGAEYVAPHHSRIPDAMEDLIRFAERDDIPALAQIAIAHAQFETIHPFADGNGRTGRALAQAMLRNKGVVSTTTAPLSSGLLTDTGSYFRALETFRSGDAGPIIDRFIDAARIASFRGTDLVDRLNEQLDASRTLLTGVRSDATAWKVLPLLVAQPVVNVRYLQSQHGLAEVAALRAMETLTERGILRERTGWKRNRVWAHQGILSALDDYAESIRRIAGDRRHRH